MELIAYSYLSIRNDVLKILMLGAIAIVFQQLELFLVFLIPMMSIRLYLGGVHSKTFFGCLMLTGFEIAGGILLASSISNFIWIGKALVGLSMTLPWYFGPFVSTKRKPLNLKERNARKRKALLLETGICIMAFIFWKGTKKDAVLDMSIIFANMQLIILRMKGGEKMKILDQLGNVLLDAAEWIYNLTSGILCGEEDAPQSLKKED